MTAQNNPIWLMSSAFPGRPLAEVIERTGAVGAQGIEACVFRHGGTRDDHIATHMDYETFGPDQARETIEQTGGQRLILAPACVIPTNTPPENLQAIAEVNR